METACDIALIYYLICISLLLFYLWVDLLKMFNKHVCKLEIFESLCWSYGKWCRLIVRSIVQLVDPSVMKVLILALPYKSPPRDIFRLKKLTYTPMMTLFFLFRRSVFIIFVFSAVYTSTFLRRVIVCYNFAEIFNGTISSREVCFPLIFFAVSSFEDIYT